MNLLRLSLLLPRIRTRNGGERVFGCVHKGTITQTSVAVKVMDPVSLDWFYTAELLLLCRKSCKMSVVYTPHSFATEVQALTRWVF